MSDVVSVEQSDRNAVTPDVMLPDLLRTCPGVRPVLDRYGLRGCGGANGPAETVGYFARAHGVELDALLAELNAAAKGVTTPEPPRTALDELGDAIYRRFFKAGMVVILTAGAVWGALLLLRISAAHAFTAISIHQINAHGHAQIFGWVGLFVMGFAYQAFPRIKHTNLWRPDLANLTFYLMVFGIFARAVGEPLWEYAPLRVLALLAGAGEIVAIGLFVAILLRTFQLSGKPYERHDAYIVAALFFFFVQAVYDLGLLYASTTGGTREDLLRVIATYQAPLRDLQIHGFALLMILGVGIRMFPALFGMHRPGPRLTWAALGLCLAGVAAESSGFMLMRSTGQHAWAALMYLGMVALAAGSISLTLRWGLLARPTEEDRSTKFVRAAVAWLHTSMFMLLLLPVYLRVVLPAVGTLSATGHEAAQIGFSHAYYGAVRHAITVGFISLMILGMAAKVVPTLNGVDIRRLRGLWLPFLLVNLGCAMRVAFQIGTDFREPAYSIVGISGILEVTGIAIWGAHLWRIMAGRAVELAAARPERIAADDKVGYIVEWFPETLPLLIDKGFTPLANPVMRRTMARAVSLRTAATHHGLDVRKLVDELNDCATGSSIRSSERRISLPVLSA